MAKQKTKLPSKPTAAASGEYTVVARRYRPQQFGDLVGQDTVARALMNAIQTDRVAHAYLFTGVRGTGKTSTARILAKALNCIKGPTPTPCNECEICLSVGNGEDIDVLEIDGASNRGIDEVRAIRQNVATRPSRSRYKIYIIDEVHMLSPQAFNALLKTLEEPPPHVKFIFATTEVQKIPITILSRCQRFDFTGITSAKIAERLRQVVAAEGMQAEDEALLIVARRAGGSMRDAQSLLDQLLAFDGTSVTVAMVNQLLGTASRERLATLIEAIVNQDAKVALEAISQFAEEGLQTGEIFDQLIEYWRGLMLLKCAGKEFVDPNLTGQVKEKAVKHAERLTLDCILAGLDILTAGKGRLRGSNYGIVLLEMAVLRLIRIDELLPIAQLVESLKSGSTLPVSESKSTLSNVGSSAAAKKNSLTAEKTSGKPPASAADAQPKSDVEIWEKLVESVGPILAANLRKSAIYAISGPNSLVLYFEAGYTSAYDYCSQPRTVEEIQNTLKAITGRDWLVKAELRSAVAASGNSSTLQPEERKEVTHRERNEEVMKVPLLKWASEKLGARLLKADPGFGAAPASTSETDSAD